MDFAANTDDLYAKLPTGVTENSEKLGLKEVSIPEESSYLTNFLKKRVPKRRHKELNDEFGFKYRRHALDNSVKKKGFNMVPSKRKTLTSKEKKDLKLFDIKPEEQKYEMYIPLNELWKDYMRDLLNIDKLTPQNHSDSERKLLKADYHGATLTVKHSKCSSLVGHTGIILIETKHTFKIINKESKVKIIPKQNSVFTMELDGYTFTIYGDNFKFRTTERSSRKFKNMPYPQWIPDI